MNEKMNELMVNNETGEILQNVNNEVVVRETDDFIIFQEPSGKFRKEMKYREYSSHTPHTEEQKKELFKVLHSQDRELVKPMATMIGQDFEIKEVYIQPYEKFNEETGRNTYGVTCTLKTDKGYIATSSKSVYYTLLNMFNVFGYPHAPEYKPLHVKVTGTRRENGTQIDITLV